MKVLTNTHPCSMESFWERQNMALQTALSPGFYSFFPLVLCFPSLVSGLSLKLLETLDPEVMVNMCNFSQGCLRKKWMWGKNKLQNCNVPQMRVPCSPVALISGTLKPEGDAPYIPRLSHTVYSPGLISPPSLTHTQLSNFIQVLFVKYGNFLRVRHCCDKLKSLGMIWH